MVGTTLSAVAVSLLAVPLLSVAQPAAKVSKVAFIAAESRSYHASNLQAFTQGLRDLGYIEGRSILVEERFADGNLKRLAELAAQLDRDKPRVIVSAGSHATRTVMHSTRDIPIVMAYAGDPVGSKMAASLARPGGRVTGLTSLSVELGRKRVELLKESFPAVNRVAVLWNPNVPERVAQFQETQIAARALRIEVQSLELRQGEDLEKVLNTLSGKRAGALIVLADPVVNFHGARILGFAAENRLPTVFQLRDFVKAGGLMSFGPNYSDMCRRASAYVDKILKGAKPGDLPIEQPIRFELIVNLKTAKKLGLTIAPSVMARVDSLVTE